MAGMYIPGGQPTDPGYWDSDFYKNWHQAQRRGAEAGAEVEGAGESVKRNMRLQDLLKALEGLRGMFPGAFGGATSSSSGTSAGTGSGMTLPPRV